MSLYLEVISAYVYIYRILENKDSQGDLLKGDLTLNRDNYTRLGKLENKQLVQSVEIDGKIKLFDDLDLKNDNGKICTVTISKPKNQKCHSFKNFDDLLDTGPYSFERPELYYIEDIDYFSHENNKPPIIESYESVIKLIELLKSICDHHIKGVKCLSLIFLHTRKLEIQVKYQSELPKNLGALCELMNLIGSSSDHHQDKNISIFKSTLLETLYNIKTESRFKYLIDNFGDIYTKFYDNLQLFLSGFSIEKLREEIEKQTLEYTIKLNQVFAEVQNKLLAIPIALILVGGQLENTGNFAIKNLVVLLGSMLFSGFMFLLLRNQKHTLVAIKYEIDTQKLKLRHEYAAIEDKVSEAFNRLDIRYARQRNVVRIVGSAVWLGLIFTIGLYLHFTWPSVTAHFFDIFKS